MSVTEPAARPSAELAGIGKTALWEWSLERAASMGYLVLVSRAGLAEAQLPWVGLTDLLRTVARSALVGLPPPQRAALQVVMLQPDVGEPVDERSVGTAARVAMGAAGRPPRRSAFSEPDPKGNAASPATVRSSVASTSRSAASPT
jgi:hypothetical protein